MFKPLKKTLRFYRGSDFELTTYVSISGVDVDWTSWDARMMVREDYDDVSPLISLTEGAGLTLDEDDNGSYVKIEVSKTTLAALSTSLTKGVYDLELVDPAGTVGRLLMGRVRFYREATQ